MRGDPRKTARWKRTRATAIAVKEHYCYICGNFINDRERGPLSLEVDHLIPVSRGGDPFDLDNLALTHKVCNQIKGSRLVGERVERSASVASDSLLDFDQGYLDWLGGGDDGGSE